MSVLSLEPRGGFSWLLTVRGGKDCDTRYQSRVILDSENGPTLEVGINHVALMGAYEELERAILADEGCAKWLRKRKRGRGK